MNFNVKLAMHDWPKRSQSLRTDINVEAPSREDAMTAAIEQGRIKWPGAKIKAFDVTGYQPQVNAALQGDEKRAKLTIKKP